MAFYNSCQYLIPEHSVTRPLQWNPVPLSTPTFVLAPGNHQSAFCLYGFAILNISYKWSPFHAICRSRWRTSFTKHTTSKVHPCRVKQHLISFYGWIIFHRMEMLSCIYPLISWWMFRSFQLLPFAWLCKLLNESLGVFPPNASTWNSIMYIYTNMNIYR